MKKRADTRSPAARRIAAALSPPLVRLGLYALGASAAGFLLAAALVMVLQYLFPTLARFDASTKDTLKNACLLALAHLPKTALMTAAAVGAAIISLWNSLTVSVAVLVWLIIGFAAMSMGNAGILAKIFEGYLTKPEDAPLQK